MNARTQTYAKKLIQAGDAFPVGHCSNVRRVWAGEAPHYGVLCSMALSNGCSFEAKGLATVTPVQVNPCNLAD